MEGNYLLLDTPPWDTMRGAFHRTAMVVVDAATLRRRLVARWTGYGFPPAEATEKAEGNDLPNGRMVMDNSRAADVEVDGNDT